MFIAVVMLQAIAFLMGVDGSMLALTTNIATAIVMYLIGRERAYRKAAEKRLAIRKRLRRPESFKK